MKHHEREWNTAHVRLETHLGRTGPKAAIAGRKAIREGDPVDLGILTVEHVERGGGVADAALSLARNQRGHLVLVVKAGRYDKFGNHKDTETRVRIA